MGTNKECVEHLEIALGEVQDGLHRMELYMADRHRQWEETLNRLSDARFGSSECENFDEALSRIRQTGSLREYQREFERLGNRVRGWTQKALVGTFMGGLKSEISDGIRMFKPQTLKDAISFTRMKDDQLMRQRKFLRPTPPVRASLALSLSTSTTPVAPIRHLSWDEIQRRRLQGLCFNCNERFTAGHQCQGAKLLMLEGHDEGDEAVCYNIHDKQNAADHLEEFMEPEITLHALTGWTAPKTIQVTARIGSNAIFTLIDSGSIHNFISERMTNLLCLPVVFTKAFIVRVANEKNLKCQEKFNEVQVDPQGSIFSLTLYSPPLTGLDLVLGIQWLELLGSMVYNWKQLTMDFFWANKARRLEGIDDHEIQAATFKEISKEIDHIIPLKEGIALVNVRPYRYAHYHKEEIEKQVQEMLNSGLVQPSTSPFSSPVILVKKKDGNWHFCTDYRALNAATIKDRFPIPIVEDMLDELYGYYRKFVSQYGVITRPLTNLLKKGQFVWDDKVESAFIALKQAMTITPTHAMSNFNDSFTIETDASSEGIGAVLSQQGKLVAFMSRALGEDIKHVATINPYIQTKGHLATDHPERSYKWRHGLLFHKGKVFVPDDNFLRTRLLHEVHDTKTGGHSGILRTFKKLGQQFYWSGVHRSVKDYIKGCDVCQKIKAETMAPGKDAIMVVVDRFSKSAHFLSLTYPFTAKIMADKFVDGIIKLHGMSISIISDCDPIFVSKFWQEFFKLSGTKLKLSSAYHPQNDGQTEVVNRCVEQYLRCFALYGRLPPSIPLYTEGLSAVHEVDHHLLHRDALLKQLKTYLETLVNRMKQMADRKRRDVSFEVSN
ncbi:uncharacterized protein LOC133681574 [Populus nigra]|uniref:uncharacterized protein LOC133681574 n=1 Tax=Populus nigra TaxID=3691 RepID=UPI002B269E6A|nr:uncharacterized protein LOC133681574 [Populus nigra]